MRMQPRTLTLSRPSQQQKSCNEREARATATGAFMSVTPSRASMNGLEQLCARKHVVEVAKHPARQHADVHSRCTATTQHGEAMCMHSGERDAATAR